MGAAVGCLNQSPDVDGAETASSTSSGGSSDTESDLLSEFSTWSEQEEAFAEGRRIKREIRKCKKNGDYEKLVKLVIENAPDRLVQTRKMVASLYLVRDGNRTKNFKQAEKHYVAVGEWEEIMHVYRTNGRWDDARRVARKHGGNAEEFSLCLSEALRIIKEENEEAAVAFLKKNKLGPDQVRKALKRKDFETALEIQKINNAVSAAFEDGRGDTESMKQMRAIYIQQGEYLQKQKKYSEAEDCYKRGGEKLRAFEMYFNHPDKKFASDNAVRVANDLPGPDQNAALGRIQTKFQ